MTVLDQFSLAGKVALVTGGAGPQYGRCITAALAEAGARKYIAARTLGPLEDVAAEHQAAGRDVRPVQFDLGETDAIRGLRDRLLEESGHIDVLVNNAVTHPMRDGHFSDPALWDESMRVNARGVFVICREFGEAMAADRGGSVINVSSIYGVVGPDPTHYRGTDMPSWQPDYWFHKAGLVNVTRYFAAYYGPKGVRFNSIAPGGFLVDALPDVFVERYSDRTYLGRMANENDVKGVVVFLASEASAYITAACIPVDGGYTAK